MPRSFSVQALGLRRVLRKERSNVGQPFQPRPRKYGSVSAKISKEIIADEGSQIDAVECGVSFELCAIGQGIHERRIVEETPVELDLKGRIVLVNKDELLAGPDQRTQPRALDGDRRGNSPVLRSF